MKLTFFIFCFHDIMLCFFFQLSWSADSKSLLSASADKTAKIWDLEANTVST